MQEYEEIGFSSIKLRDGFFKRMQNLIQTKTVKAVYDRFKETNRFEALKCAPVEKSGFTPHIFWDSDVYKWIEGVAYITALEKNDELEALADSEIDDIYSSCAENGYFNSYFLVVERDMKFKKRDDHELYTLGHMIEAAIAYDRATGKRRLLDIAIKFTNLVYDVFYVKNSAAFETCGHPEIELALAALYEYTGDKKYYELGTYFLDKRGNNEKDKKFITNSGVFMAHVEQSHLPVRKQHTAEGHAVRACYLYSGMADFARLSDDSELLDACKDLFDDIMDKKMYITGGIGSTYVGEAFTVAYDLDPKRAYAETCAAIAYSMFAERMQQIEPNGKYGDIIEREIYNGAASGISLDGTAFFYDNPLELDPTWFDMNNDVDREGHRPLYERVNIFSCSCCPPNLVRFYSSASKYIFTHKDDTIYVNQFTDCTAELEGKKVSVATRYPLDGQVVINADSNYKIVAVRIPGWCNSFKANKTYTVKNGYAYFENDATDLCIIFDICVSVYRASAEVHECAGKVCVCRGPIVYCMEGVDNGVSLKSIKIDFTKPINVVSNDMYSVPDLIAQGNKTTLSAGLYSDADATMEKVDIKLIPFFAHANRGSCEMLVWINE